MRSFIVASLAAMFTSCSNTTVFDGGLYVEDDTEYTNHAPPNTYNSSIKQGDVRLLIIEHIGNGRHDALVTHLARLSAEKIAQKISGTRPTINTLYPNVIVNGARDKQALFLEMNNADVINYSSGTALGDIDTIDPTILLQGLKRPIFVQATGNDGEDTTANISTISFYPYSIMVGEVSYDENGVITLDAHSSRNAPTLVSLNHSDIAAAYKYTDQAHQFKKAAPEVKIDEQGYMTGIQGTSFAAPNIAGALAAARSVYPEFSNAEMIAVLCASCVPLRPSAGEDIQKTTAGLYYDEQRWGYGVFNPYRFIDNLRLMDEIKSKATQRQADTSCSTEAFERKKIDGQKHVHEHRFTIHEDCVVTKISLSGATNRCVSPPPSDSQDPCKFEDIVYTVDVTSPSGTTVSVPINPNTLVLQLTSNAFLGERAKGEWTIRSTGLYLLNLDKAALKEKTFLEVPDQGRVRSFSVHGQALDSAGNSPITEFLKRVDKSPLPVPNMSDKEKDLTPH